MDIVKELTRLHELVGETTLLNFRALMQNELRKLIQQAQEEATELPALRTAAQRVVDAFNPTPSTYSRGEQEEALAALAAWLEDK